MPATFAIHAARAIVRGDVQRARAELLGQPVALSVAEARALGGSIAEAERRYGVRLDGLLWWRG